MNIIVNGNPQPVPDKTTLSVLLQELGLQGKRVAIEINRHIVPRSGYGEYTLKSGDQIEIVKAIGGG